jgi:hypothetical protein
LVFFFFTLRMYMQVIIVMARYDFWSLMNACATSIVQYKWRLVIFGKVIIKFL